MNKREFLERLEQRLCGLPQEEVSERLLFYAEMIDDRIEDGLSEEEAVCDIGNAEDIAVQIISQVPLTKLVKNKIKPQRKLQAWEIVLLAVGSPLWIALGITFFSVILSVYVSLWAVIVSLWSVFASFIGVAIGSIGAGIGFCIGLRSFAGIPLIGAGFICAGLSIACFFGCRAATKGIIWLTRRIALGIKRGFMRKEAAL